MKPIHYATICAAMFILSQPSAAQIDKRRQATKPTQPNLSLKAPKITSSGTFVRCRINDVAMSIEGVGFTCATQDNMAYLVASDGGNMPGGVSATMSLVIEMAKEPKKYRRLRIKEAKGSSSRICGLLRGSRAKSDGLTCVQVMAIQMSSKDSSVSTGSANPDGPSIPTAPANPDGPNIPTAPASPD